MDQVGPNFRGGEFKDQKLLSVSLFFLAKGLGLRCATKVPQKCGTLKTLPHLPHFEVRFRISEKILPNCCRISSQILTLWMVVELQNYYF